MARTVAGASPWSVSPHRGSPRLHFEQKYCTAARVSPAAAVATIVLALIGPVHGQGGGVDMKIDIEDVGIRGWVRPGTWTPLRVSLTTAGSETRTVRCQWAHADADGDQVIAERRSTLNANRTQHVWLYAAVPFTTTAQTQWRVEVMDDKTGQSLAAMHIKPPQVMSPVDRAVAVVGDMTFFLEAYDQLLTQHERCRVLAGIGPGHLPDRWYGLQMCEALVWSDLGGAPDAPIVRPESRAALREWVRRGGHLVVILPAHSDSWMSSSMAPILPDIQTPQTEQKLTLPHWLGSSDQSMSIPMTSLVPAGDTAVVLRDADDIPVIAAGQHGFGRVTLVGVDLTDARLSRKGLPSPICPTPESKTIWRRIFGWPGPIYRRRYQEEQINKGNIESPRVRHDVDLGSGTIAPRVRMAQAAAPALFIAIVFFLIYWTVAGPVGFAVLRGRGRAHYAWLVFTLIVGISVVIAWGGALILRPQEDRIDHFTVVDAVAANHQEVATVRVRSWLALLVARHGKAQVVVGDPSTELAYTARRNTLACLGAEVRTDSGGFIGAQRYRAAAAAPAMLTLPMRSTAKSLQVDYVADYDDWRKQLREPWVMPNGRVVMVSKSGGLRPAGILRHGLPGTLVDVRIVLCPGDDGQPITVRPPDDWPPDEPLDLGALRRWVRLVQPPTRRKPRKGHYDDRRLKSEGHLGNLMQLRTGGRWVGSQFDSTQADMASNEMAPAIEMLSFYSILPPPEFRRRENDQSHTPITYQRSLGRGLDLSHLLTMRRLIVIGHLVDGPNPTPMKVDGRQLPSEGWTVVRWICPLPAVNPPGNV